ncbi:MAG: ADP-dependent NAD(P)H-hydrate dehydratase [Longimicrobiales bacterium]
MGPGLGTGERALEQLKCALASRADRSVLLDADALTLLAGSGEGQWDRLVDGHVLITPHPGEMARLTGRSIEDVQSDRLGAARRFAAEKGIATLLKGTPSVVAGADNSVWVDGAGSSDLAVAGMGDVLTGTAGALLAQGLGAEEAACVALYLTGHGARQAALGASLTPSDVVERMAEALLPRGNGYTDLPFPFVTFDQDPSD